MDSYPVIIQGEKVYAPASIVIDLRAQLAESERRRVELVAAVRPVVAWWKVAQPFRAKYHTGPGGGNALHIYGPNDETDVAVTEQELDALAALVGDGK